MKIFVCLVMSICVLACGGNSREGGQVEVGEVRSIDGSSNNLENPTWGSVNARLVRNAPADYADGVSAPSGSERPNPRTISNALMAKQELVKDPRGLSSFVWQWGQFLDHDISLTEAHTPPEPLMIRVPKGDRMFDPFSTGAVVIPFMRSVYDRTSGTDVENPRAQINQLTAFIDASNVYGVNEERAHWLRAGVNGLLKVSAGNLMPFNDGTQENHGGTTGNLFVAGDVRANEQTGLTALHTLFVREHNRLALQYAEHNPDWNDEQLYQAARRYVGALMQRITYDEFLPALLGSITLEPYTGYDASVNPGVATEFSTVLYRLGHSMIPETLLRLDESASDIEQGNLPLRDAFFNSSRIVAEGGIEPLLRGLSVQQMDKLDVYLSDNLRNFLFGAPGSGGMDLACLNIQRGRDHGIMNYNALRYYYGLDPLNSIDEISSKPEVVAVLKDLYDHVDEIDPWVGALAEDQIPGSSVGELIGVALVRQFEALRDGDRFWYERDPNISDEEQAEIQGTSLADVILRNTSIENIQDSVFFAR